MNMDWRLYIVSVLTCIAIKIALVSTEQTKRDASLEDPANMDESMNGLDQIYAMLPDAEDDLGEFDKRRSLMRFGKRGSLMRFGKRGTILRFGKRPSIMRFGKRGYEDDGEMFDNAIPEDAYNYNGDSGISEGFPSFKRGSIMRFGKRPSLMRFGRSKSDMVKKPHVPWRYGKNVEKSLLNYRK